MMSLIRASIEEAASVENVNDSQQASGISTTVTLCCRDAKTNTMPESEREQPSVHDDEDESYHPLQDEGGWDDDDTYE
jgi:hypothetical protein